MNLDDLSTFHRLDTQKCMDQINSLPDRLQSAWDAGSDLPLADAWQRIHQVLVLGMGESAVGAELAAAYSASQCPVPVVVHRDYGVPAWARGEETLVIACSASGDTEETVAAFEQALSRDCPGMAVTVGGRLAELAKQKGCPVWPYGDAVQSQSAVATTFGLLLAAFYRLGLVPDPQADLRDTLSALRSQQANLLPEIPVVRNPAKRMAGQLVDRWVAVFAAGDFAPVARYWKGQINRFAKAWSQFESLPEADHNSLVGLSHPEHVPGQTIALFLSAPSNHPRDLLRLDLTRRMFMVQGVNTDFIPARGENKMAHLWTLLHMGDYIAYYLAMAYGEDPSQEEAIAMFKQELDELP